MTETQKWFITQLLEKVALFYHKSIQRDTHNHQYYLNLAFILYRLNQFDDALHWTNAMRGGEDQRSRGTEGHRQRQQD
jgi:hypothetical protein